MNLNEMIVCEREPYWVIRVRQLLQDPSIKVRSVTTLQECEKQLRMTRSCLALTEVHDRNVADVWQWIAGQTSRSHHPHIVIAANRGTHQYHWDLLEAGATHVIDSPRNTAQLLPIVSRCKQRYQNTTTPAKVSPFAALTDFDSIWSNLPWS